MEFGFFGALGDRAGFLEAILGAGDYRLISNLSYSTPEPKQFVALEPELVAALSINKMLFIAGPFTKGTIPVVKLERGSQAGKWEVSPLRGGPLMVLSLPGCRSGEDGFELTAGDLSHVREYWDVQEQAWLRPTPEFKGHFKIIAMALRRNLLRRDVGAKVWIGREGWSLVERGEARLRVGGKWLAGQEGQVHNL